MIAERRKERCTQLAVFQTVSHILKLLHGLSRCYRRKHSSIAGRAGILRIFLCHLGKIRTTFDCVIYGIDTHFGCVQSRLLCFLRYRKEDMRSCEQSLRTYLSHQIIIISNDFVLHIGVRDERRAYLLVAITEEFLLERA